MSKLDHFNYDLLPALGALLAERNVTRAAERLCVSQPAMSGALQRLRDHFNDPLLVRAGRDMELTPLGQGLAEPIRELLLQTRALLALGPDFLPAESRRSFSLAMSDYPSTTLLPLVTRRLTAEAPGVRLTVEPLLSPTYERLDVGALDMVITAKDPRLDQDRFSSHFERTPLFEDGFVCVVDRDNARVGNRLSLEAFKALPHAMVDFGRGMTTLQDDALRQHAVHLTVAATTSSFITLLFMIPGTDLIGTVQERLARRLEPILPIRILEPPLPIPRLTESLIWHRRASADHGHAWLRGIIEQEAATLAEAATAHN